MSNVRHERTRRSRSPQGERGLKYNVFVGECHIFGRSPQGERGLKYVGDLHGLRIAEVALRKGSVD